MAQGGSFVGASGDDQDRLLDEASAVVKEQAFYMKRAIEGDNLREALKHASNLICELRTSLLSPKNYYELYMLVFQETQKLADFFDDKSRHGRKMMELYESVQHAGNILPRLYLLCTVGASYIKSKEASAKEILKDMNELCKGVQHPLRGLFLRHYLSQMVKDKLPDTGTEYEGEGGNIDDAFEFMFSNFNESNRLWVRMQHQGPVKDKQKREKERNDLKVLVGANLVKISQLNGMTMEYYKDNALPKILEHVVSVKDTMSQQYLFESMIQVFPDEFHIATLELILAAYTKAQPNVDMKPIMVTLMNRLAQFLSSDNESNEVFTAVDVFSLFRTHLQAILERALEPGATGPQSSPGMPDISAPLEVQAAFMQFTISLYPSKLHYVDIILNSTADIVQKFFQRMGGSQHQQQRLSGAGADKVADLLSCPLKALALQVLDMEHYTTLMKYLDFQTRKQVALAIVNMMVEDNRAFTGTEAVSRLFGLITCLIKDEDDTPNDEGTGDKETFCAEQHQVCKLVHQIRVEDTDLEFQMLSAMRGFYGQGGPCRMAHTLQPTFFRAIDMLAKLQAGDRRREAGEEIPVPTVREKKIFQFMHKTNTALVQASADTALRLWLVGAVAADQVDTANPGSYEPICYEFLTQGLICFEEEISDTQRQYMGIYQLVGTMMQLNCLEGENFDTVSQKIVQHAARLLKKPMQCRAIATCSHLFWCPARKDGKKVLECLQKCLKITDAVVTSDAKQVDLWVEMLDKYIHYCEDGCEEVTAKFVQSLLGLCWEHVGFAENESGSQTEARNAKKHLKSTIVSLRHTKLAGELSLEEPAPTR